MNDVTDTHPALPLLPCQVEYSVNDVTDTHPLYLTDMRKSFERLIRKVHNYPKKPAVVLVHSYIWNHLPPGEVQAQHRSPPSNIAVLPVHHRVVHSYVWNHLPPGGVGGKDVEGIGMATERLAGGTSWFRDLGYPASRWVWGGVMYARGGLHA